MIRELPTILDPTSILNQTNYILYVYVPTSSYVVLCCAMLRYVVLCVMRYGNWDFSFLFFSRM